MQSRGLSVGAVVSAQDDALAALAHSDISTAILDIHIGNDTSYEVARACLSRNITVIFLSGDQDEARPDDLRTIHLMTKPVDYQRLVDVLNRPGKVPDAP